MFFFNKKQLDMQFKVEGLSLKSELFVMDWWNVCHIKVEDLSLLGVVLVTIKCNTCHYSGKIITAYFKILKYT
jgi:hypothetical protein